MRPGAHPGFKPFNKKKNIISRLSLKIAKRSFIPRISKIAVSNVVKISDHRTTIEVISHNGGTTFLATTQTTTR
jgi:hypothetical protein